MSIERLSEKLPTLSRYSTALMDSATKSGDKKSSTRDLDNGDLGSYKPECLPRDDRLVSNSNTSLKFAVQERSINRGFGCSQLGAFSSKIDEINKKIEVALDNKTYTNYDGVIEQLNNINHKLDSVIDTTNILGNDNDIKILLNVT